MIKWQTILFPGQGVCFKSETIIVSPSLWRVEKSLLSMGYVKDSVCNLNGTNQLFYILAGLDFEALLIKPKEVKDGVKLPLIVTPHGWLLSLWLCNVRTK